MKNKARTYQLTIPGVTGILELMAGIEARMSRGMQLDDGCEDRGYHIGSKTRRELRDSIQTDAALLIALWSLFETAHLGKECETPTCPVNVMEPMAIMEVVSDKQRDLQGIIDHANEMNAEAGDVVRDDPPQIVQDPFEILRQIFGNSAN